MIINDAQRFRRYYEEIIDNVWRWRNIQWNDVIESQGSSSDFLVKVLIIESREARLVTRLDARLLLDLKGLDSIPQ